MDKLIELLATARSTEPGADLGNLHMAGITGGQRILIIDDDHGIADTLALIFSAHRYAARVAYSAEEAIEMIAEWPPHVAIIDVMLPRMNGIELAIVLKANHPGCRTLLFSGQPDTSKLVEEALKRGHRFEILAKPLPPTFLLETVAGLLEPNREGSSDA
ncbi:MAG: response regulator [Terracidiphilus sp.]